MANARLILLLVLAALPVGQSRPQEVPPDRLAAVPSFFDIALSPSGRHLAARAFVDGHLGVIVYDVDEQRFVVGNRAALAVNWLRWADDRRLLASVRFFEQGNRSSYSRRLMMLDIEKGTDRNLHTLLTGGIARIESADVDGIGGNTIWQDRLVSVIPGAETRLILSYGSLYQYNVDTTRVSRVSRPPPDARYWFTDRTGEARIVRTFQWDKRIQERLVRDDGADAWREVAEMRLEDLPVFVPLLFSATDDDLVYAISDHVDGTPALYGWHPSSGSFDAEPILPVRRGLVGAVFNPQHTELYGLRYADPGGGIAWLDPAHAEIEAHIAASLPGRSVRVLSVSDRLERVIVSASSATGPGDYFVSMTRDNVLMNLGAVYRNWAERPVAQVRLVAVPADDGASIDGYLTVPTATSSPVASSSARRAVVIPHGGPYAHDFFAFSALVQILSEQGYTVLQLNDRRRLRFRDEIAASLNEWTPVPPDDAIAAAKYLAREGLADADRICVLGFDYGGYTALMAAALAPDLFACAASVNSPTNLNLLDYNPVYGALMFRPPPEESPINHADAITAPVLLVHGEDNRLVTPEHSRAMRNRLVKAGRDAEYLQLRNQDHEIGTVEANATFLRTLLDFLRKHLG